MTMAYLQSTAYSGISDRGKNLDDVKRELDRVVASQPTQIQPDDREGFLNALLDDLAYTDGATWTLWPEDVYLLALTAIKTLGRNPIGSETLFTEAHLSTILRHTSLPLSLCSSRPVSPQTSPSALEAMKILANILVLHPAGRQQFAKLDGGNLIAKELIGRDESGKGTSTDEGDWGDSRVERLFLLGRIGFLVTMDRVETVGQMVNKEDLVESLVYYLTALPLTPPNYAALGEVLKLVNNVLRYYPYSTTSTSTSSSKEPWGDKLEPLLYPLLVLLYTIPTSNFSPPLTQILHTLLSIPFTSSLLPTWHSKPLSPTSPPTHPSPARSVKSLFSRKTKTSPPKTSPLPLPLTTPNTPPRSPISRPTTPTPRKANLPDRVDDPLAFPKRVLDILTDYFDKTLRPALRDESELPRDWILDELLPPVLLLLARAASGCGEMRMYLKDRLLPFHLNRSSEAGPLERRKSTLGMVLVLMGSGEYHQCRDTAGEMMWEICGRDASVLSHEIGYGNAAGLLFHKGITAPPPARIDEIQIPTPTQPKLQDPRHPITSLHPEEVTAHTSAFEGMTEDEKEREAEKLFVQFERMENNQMIKAKGDDGVERGVGEVVREKMERRGEDDGEEERKRVEEEEREEREAMRDLAAYRRRMGGK